MVQTEPRLKKLRDRRIRAPFNFPSAAGDVADACRNGKATGNNDELK
jgi:hypothetical protein